MADHEATDPTVAATQVGRPGGTEPPATPRPTSTSDTQRKVGDEIRAATVEQFGVVDATRFEVLAELARGGLGRVSRARDPRTNRIVAIKEVLQPTADTVARFAREALATANLQHPSIVPVYEVGRWRTGEPYYAMKLVQGRTLHELIKQTPASERVALVPHVIAVADALAYAHGERVIHRDLKPGNVLVGAYGETVVIDWGLAKNLATGEELTELPHATTIPPSQGETIAGAVMGTPAYMPPEQARGEPLDERADVYAIGAILYQVLAGRQPYAEARALDELLEAVTTRPPTPLVQLAPDTPPELIAIVDKAMARDAGARYATAAGIADDLRKFQAGKLVAAFRYSTGQLVARWLRQHRAAVVTAVVAVLVLAGFAAASVWQIARERDDANAARDLARDAEASAKTQRALAEKRLADGLVELARQALDDGEPDHALAYVAGMDPGTSSVATRVVVAEARAAYSGLVALAPNAGAILTTAQLAADGSRVFTVDANGHARRWDFAAARAGWTRDGIYRFALSPDDTRLIALDHQHDIALLAADTGAVVRTWPGFGAKRADTDAVLAWSVDGSHFAAAAPDGRVVIGAPADASLQHADGHTGAVGALAFSPDGRRLASTGADGVVLVHDAMTGGTIARLDDRADALAGLVWLDDDRLATGDRKGVVRVWRVSARAVERRMTAPYELLGVTTGPGWLATYGRSTDVTVWDVATGAVRARLGGHLIGANHAVFDGTWLTTSDETGNVFAWDPATGQRIAMLPPEGTSVDLSTRGGRVAAFGSGRVRVLRIAGDGLLTRISGHAARIRDLAFSADGRVLWSASNDGTARGFDFETGGTVVLGEVSGHEAPLADQTTGIPPPNPHGLRSLTIAPDGTIATASEDGTIARWDPRTGARKSAWHAHDGRARKVVFSRDGATAFSVGDTTLRRWDVASGKETARTELGLNTWDVMLVDDGRTVVTQSDDQYAAVLRWNAADLAKRDGFTVDTLHQLVATRDGLVVGVPPSLAVVGFDLVRRAAGGAEIPREVTVHDDILAVANYNFEVQLVDASSLAPIRAWRTHDYVNLARFRPDGSLLATASAGRRVSLWDPSTGRLLGETAAIPANLTQLAWSPDGRRVAFAGYSGTIWVWEVAPAPATPLDAFVRCVSPWQLADHAVELVARPFDPNSCRGVL